MMLEFVNNSFIFDKRKSIVFLLRLNEISG